jgi:hypothetical protein
MLEARQAESPRHPNPCHSDEAGSAKEESAVFADDSAPHGQGTNKVTSRNIPTPNQESDEIQYDEHAESSSTFIVHSTH